MFAKNLTVLICLFAFSISSQAAPGDFDLSFGNGGKAVSPIGRISADRSFATALQPDGKIIAAGHSFDGSSSAPNLVVVRINADGSLDTAFGVGGKAVKRLSSSSRAVTVIIQPDGKIVAGGSAALANGAGILRTAFLLVRFNSDGSVDNSFGTNGTVRTLIDGDLTNNLTSLAIQANGKIVAAGFTSGAISPLSMIAARYNADGSLDNGFDGDGKLSVNFNALGSRANVAAIQPDGKIVFGGYVRNNNTAESDFALVRLNANGSLDDNFDGDGKLITEIGESQSFIRALKIQPDGRIVAAGNSDTFNQVAFYDLAVARYNSDGSLDASFDADGIAITDVGLDVATGVSLQTDGKIIVGGHVSINNSSNDFLSVRYNFDGSLDVSYNGNGKVVIQATAFSDIAAAMLLQADGKVVLVGYSSDAFDSDIVLTRNNSNGLPDASFDGDGIALIELANSMDTIVKTALQSDGKIVAAGHSFNGSLQEVTLARYNADGSLDTSFGSQGAVFTPFANSNSSANDVVIQPDGKIIIVVAAPQLDKFILVRYNSNGSLDASFGSSGIVGLQVSAHSHLLYSLVLQPDGKIIAGGYSYHIDGAGATLVRLNADGSLDTSFGNGGKVVTADFNRTNRIYAIALGNDGKIIVAGQSYTTSDSIFFVNRYHANGALDVSFSGDGIVYTSFNTQDIANAVAVQNDGKIVAAGSSNGNFALARYNADGSLDVTFDGDGKVVTPIQTNSSSRISDLVMQSNNKLLAAGVYDNGVDTDGAVFRYNADGSLDNSFGSGGKVIASIGEGNNQYNGVLLQPDGKIVAAGYSNNGANDDFTIVRYQGGDAIVNQTLFDFDGDGKADVSVFRPSSGAWYLLNSSSGFAGVSFGISTDKIVPADYDGDGKTDIAVYRSGTWYLQRSQLGFTGIQFGAADDVPQPADHDGDGKAEIAVFRQSNGGWYFYNLTTNQTSAVNFGLSGDRPVAADYDGDGKADVAVFRPSTGTWYLQRTTLGFTGIRFGEAADKPVPADYDGDGKADVAVFRPSTGTWYLQRSQTGFTGIAFGTAGDLPTPADYDGDGKADVSVFRPSSGTWYLQRSQAGFTGVQFGAGGDAPVPHAFVP